MMYILTQEELDSLTSKISSSASSEILQDLCTRVANSESVKEGWFKGKPWGCIHTVDFEWYCDDCPVQNVCPSRKQFSQ